METPSASSGLANSGFIPYDTPAAIPAAIPITMLLSLFISGAKIQRFLPKCESGFAQIKEDAAGVAEGGGYEVTGAAVAEFELFL